MTPAAASQPAAPQPADGSQDGDLERSVGRLLTLGTYVAVGLLAIGVAALLLAGRSPLEGGPAFDLGRLASDVLALRPEGFLWLGLVAVVATPAARVGLSLVGYLRGGERVMAGVAAAILGIILVSVLLAIGTEG